MRVFTAGGSVHILAAPNAAVIASEQTQPATARHSPPTATRCLAGSYARRHHRAMPRDTPAPCGTLQTLVGVDGAATSSEARAFDGAAEPYDSEFPAPEAQ